MQQKSLEQELYDSAMENLKGLQDSMKNLETWRSFDELILIPEGTLAYRAIDEHSMFDLSEGAINIPIAIKAVEGGGVRGIVGRCACQCIVGYCNAEGPNNKEYNDIRIHEADACHPHMVIGMESYYHSLSLYRVNALLSSEETVVHMVSVRGVCVRRPNNTFQHYSVFMKKFEAFTKQCGQ